MTSTTPPEAICPTLANADLCLPCTLARTDARPPGLTLRRRRLERQETLFRQGDEFHAIYAVRAGSLKTVIHGIGGTEQVAGLHLVGEILGLDGLARDRHECTAIALEDSDVVAVPYAEAVWWQSSAGGLHALIARLLSREMVRERERLQLLALGSAEARLAGFLLALSKRMQGRGFSPFDFVLRLTRQEIGSYLGLKLETVSRAFAKLHRQHVLEVDGKNVHLRDLQQLEGLAAA